MASVVRNLVEPAFIVGGFTTGCLINRRRNVNDRITARGTGDIESSAQRYTDDSSSSPPLKPAVLYTEAPLRKSPNIVFALLSRFFNAFPFLVEIWYWNLTYWIYQLLRALSARIIAGNEAVFARAQGHSLTVLSFEKFLGVDYELSFQQYVMREHAWLMPVLAKIYYSHISLGVCFIVYTYTVLPPSTFRRIRRTIALDNAIAFVIVTLWRCYPPRLLPQEYGYIDILHSKAGGGGSSAWNNNRFQLTIAAMPSLHFGTALFLAVSICRFSPHRFLRVLAPLWPMAMLVTIVATANHFLTDAAVGAVIPFLGWRYNRLILKLKPIQDWLFAPLTRRLDLVDDSTAPEMPKVH